MLQLCVYIVHFRPEATPLAADQVNDSVQALSFDAQHPHWSTW